MWTTYSPHLTGAHGGFIAYNGTDRSQIRQTARDAFRLRPKHTPSSYQRNRGPDLAFTTATAFLLVRPVRDVIMNGEDAIKERKVLLITDACTEAVMSAI